jgi:uncharacterized protein (DUF1499 family)
MGLAISRSIVDAHGGRLWAEPSPRSGATFSFSLPAAAAAEGLVRWPEAASSVVVVHRLLPRPEVPIMSRTTRAITNGGETTMFKFSGKRPANLGVRDGKLAPCPGSPNCVSSQAEASDKTHAIEPLRFTGDPGAAMRKLRTVVEGIPRTTVIESRPDYLYAEFSTPLMGFVDDVEFHQHGMTIHVRSASRLGYSDLGVNRKRIESIRDAFSKR